MQIPALTSRPLWLSEHYWPGLADGLVLAQVQRCALVPDGIRWLATVVVPGQDSAFGLFAAGDGTDVERALAIAGARSERISPALHVTAAEGSTAVLGRAQDHEHGRT